MTERGGQATQERRDRRENGIRAISSRTGHERLTPERSEEIRLRILERAYDSPAVAAAIARRLLERGDL